MAEVEIALLTERRYESPSDPDWYVKNILHEDQLIQAAFDELGVTHRRVDWSRTDVDWSEFECAVFRTTWDYFDRFTQWDAWLHKAAAATRLINDHELIRWNMDKHYLADLASGGVPVVPTRFVELGATQSLADLMRDEGWNEAVVKPAVSGAARHTYRVRPGKASEHESIWAELLAQEAMLVQPFQRDVVESGEVTVVAIDGEVTHAVRKVAKAGDFRVQDDFGGTVLEYTATDEEVELATHAIGACPKPPLYGRVDMVRSNDGQLCVMELELIEPELWLRAHPPAAARLAQAVARTLTGRSSSGG